MYEFGHKANETFLDYIKRHVEWGYSTFGTPADGRGPLGPLDHLKKELKEIEDDPNDLKEWIDAIILAIDGFIRAGGKPHMLLPMLFEKQTINSMRNWPDWRTMHPDKAIEHVRTREELDAVADKAFAPARTERLKEAKKNAKTSKLGPRNYTPKAGSEDNR